MAGIQLGGLASGFDTTSMVESLMQVEQLKVDKVQQQKIKVEWQKEAYISVSDRYSNFVLKMRETFGITNSVSTHGLTRPSTINSLSWVNKATSSNSDILNAHAASEATPGTHQVTVKQLAENFKAASSANVSKNKDGKNLADQLGLDPNEEINLKISNGKEIVEIKGKASNLTMDDLVKKMNEVPGIKASYDKSIDRFFIQTTETGAESKLSITDDTGNGGEILKALHLDGDIKSGQEYTGKNAIIDYNGAKDIEFSSNNFRLQGIDFSLKNSNVNETVTITVDTDVDAVMDKVKTFVNEYNNMVTDIGKILSEATYKDYSPLTETQKAEMTDKQIELWEEKAKSGLLKNDSLISSVQQNLRTAILQEVKLSNGDTMSMFDIGIQTKGYSSAATSGELQIDEDKLRAAISDDPKAVLELFFGTPKDQELNTSDRNLSSTQIQQKRQESGIFNRITDVVVNGVSQIVNKAGSGDSATNYRNLNSFIMLDFTASGSKSLLDNRLTEINKRITNLNYRMSQTEARYWSQFTAMETAIAKLQSQQSALGSF